MGVLRQQINRAKNEAWPVCPYMSKQPLKQLSDPTRALPGALQGKLQTLVKEALVAREPGAYDASLYDLVIHVTLPNKNKIK